MIIELLKAGECPNAKLAEMPDGLYHCHGTDRYGQEFCKDNLKQEDIKSSLFHTSSWNHQMSLSNHWFRASIVLVIISLAFSAQLFSVMFGSGKTLAHAMFLIAVRFETCGVKINNNTFCCNKEELAKLQELWFTSRKQLAMEALQRG